jgi:predicted DNA-binding transcriptional regulator AlpA
MKITDLGDIELDEMATYRSPDDLLDTEEAAELLGLCRNRLYVLRAQKNEFPYIKIMGKVWYRYGDLVAIIKNNYYTKRSDYKPDNQEN